MVLTPTISLFKVFMSPNAARMAADVLNSGFIGQGEKVTQFEMALESYLNLRPNSLITVNSGTSALHLALHMIKDGYTMHGIPHANLFTHTTLPDTNDEVLTTALTCTATNFPVVANGYNIKWVDIDPTTLNMDLDDLQNKLTRKTRVVIAMHWGGYPLDIDKLNAILNRHEETHGFRPILIQDCAHAFGSTYYGKSLGHYGDMAMYSFQAIKHVTSVDGGALVVPPELYKRSKLLRWYGIDREEKGRTDFRCEADIEEWGFKFHMNDVNAAIGMENLYYANNIIAQHQQNAAYYDTHLQNIPGVTLLTRHSNRQSAFWIYSLRVQDRVGFYKKMKECGIAVSQVHERNDKHTAMAAFKAPLPVLDSIIGEVVSIPVGWWITAAERQYIVDCIKSGW